MTRALLLDIEGTTSAIEFVRDVLFPHARRHLASFIERRRGDAEVEAELAQAAELARAEGAGGEELYVTLERWMAQDRKATPLEALQGLLWESAFERGELVAHVYPDVPPALRRLRALGLRLFVYSSGSVRAQRAFFRHSAAGDLSSLIDGWFDTRVGSKLDAASYRAIAAQLELEPRALTFLSDSAAELDAARAAGLETRGVLRGPLALGAHPALTRFDELASDVPAHEAAPSAKAAVIALATFCHARGWAAATSGNFSMRVSPERLVITASGVDKGALTERDVLLVDLDGAPLDPGTPSAETPLHAALYRESPAIGAVAHTHSVASTVLSRRAEGAALRLAGFEMAKAIAPCVAGEPAVLTLPIVENRQDTTALAEVVRQRLAREPSAPAYLVRGHGLTTWGASAAEVRRHVEALEFMLACELAR